MPKKSKPSTPSKSRRRFPREYASVRFRLYRLHDLLEAGEKVTVERLHEEFGISERQIKDDIRKMRDEHGAPIKWSQKRMSYHYTRPFAGMPLLRLNDREALALAMSARRYGATPGSPLARAFLSVLKKIGPLVSGDTSLALDAMRDVLVAPDHHAAMEDRHIPVLHEAIARRREVIVHYERPGEEAYDRTLRPLHLAYLDHRWVLIARDVKKSPEDRPYLLVRMQEAKMTGTTFVWPKDFDADKLLSGNLRRYIGRGDFEVHIAYDAVGAAYAREALPPDKRNFTPRPDGRQELVLRLNNTIDVEKDVLRAGEHAEVISPLELRMRIRDILRAALKQYED